MEEKKWACYSWMPKREKNARRRERFSGTEIIYAPDRATARARFIHTYGHAGRCVSVRRV